MFGIELDSNVPCVQREDKRVPDLGSSLMFFDPETTTAI